MAADTAVADQADAAVERFEAAVVEAKRSRAGSRRVVGRRSATSSTKQPPLKAER
jgi:hypothetical protein